MSAPQRGNTPAPRIVDPQDAADRAFADAEHLERDDHTVDEIVDLARGNYWRN